MLVPSPFKRIYQIIILLSIVFTLANSIVFGQCSPPVIATLTHDTVTCYEASDGVLYASISGGSGSCTFEWNAFSGTSNQVTGITGSNTSAYWVIATDDSGCKSYMIYEFVPRPDSIRAFIRIKGGNAFGLIPFDVVFIDTSHGDYNQNSWFIDGESIATDQETLNHPCEVYRDTEFEIILEVSRNGFCIDEASKHSVVEAREYFAIPDVFSPNGDGFNDKFVTTHVNICELTGSIFNTRGQKTYEWTGVEEGWDGITENGKEAAVGVYYYIIDATGCDGAEYRGNKGALL